jgi:ABC-2 type transport system permease protein
VSGAGWALMISPDTLVTSTVNWMFGLGSENSLNVPSDLGGFVFLAEILVIAAASYGLLVRRYRKI